MKNLDGRLLDGARQWRCKNGHVLGLVVRSRVRGERDDYHVTRLLLFRHAIDLDVDDVRPIEEVDVIAMVEGTTLNVTCSICGEKRTWWIGEAAIQRLMERIFASRGGQENLGPEKGWA